MPTNFADLGKTRTIINRVIYLISKGINPNRIILITLTNRATDELRTRFEQLIGQDITSQLQISTIHSFCFTYLSRYGEYVGVSKPIITASNDDKTLIQNVCLFIFTLCSTHLITNKNLENLRGIQKR